MNRARIRSVDRILLSLERRSVLCSWTYDMSLFGLWIDIISVRIGYFLFSLLICFIMKIIFKIENYFSNRELFKLEIIFQIKNVFCSNWEFFRFEFKAWIEYFRSLNGNLQFNWSLNHIWMEPKNFVTEVKTYSITSKSRSIE